MIHCTFKTSYKKFNFLIKPGHFDSASLHLSVHLQANVHSSVNPCLGRYICLSFLHSLVTAFFLFWSSPRPISTSQLHALLHFHPKPINLVVFKGSYFFRMGYLILRGASRLDAFSVYPCQTWLPCSELGSSTGTPAVRPSRSSRTKDSSSQISYAHAG